MVNTNTTKVYLKLYNSTSGSVTLGTTNPAHILPCEAETTVEYQFKTTGAAGGGLKMDSALTYAVVTTGGTAGTSSPSSAISLEIAAS